MATGEIVKAGSTELSLDFGSLFLDGFTPAQQDVIRARVAHKKFDFALEVDRCMVE